MSCTKPLLYCFFFTCLLTFHSFGQADSAVSWSRANTEKKATITILWDEIEPFIYRDDNGQLIGVEYELMEGMKDFIKKRYGVELHIYWKDAKGFANIYPTVKGSVEKGLFAVSYYSITEERKKEVQFSPPYMPDLNILVTNNKVPALDSVQQLATFIKDMTGYTQTGTTMEEDINRIRNEYYAGLPIRYNEKDDYEVLRDIASHPNSLGYVPVSIYVVALQRGIKVKRQRLFDRRREGFAAIFPLHSDWKEPVDAYFNSTECKVLVASLINKYLGEEVADIILDVSVQDSLNARPRDIELLTKEREIVTQRLMDTAVEVQQQRSFRNMILVVLGCLLLLAGLLYSRFRTKQRLNDKLEQRNQLISRQNEQIEQMNQLLKLKVLQARMNPHFLFNSLNSIQYFIAADDKKASLQYISRFSAFLRKVINFGDELSISIQDEADLVREYLWLEQTRFPGQFDYEVKLPDQAQAKILPLLTHSLVEAALYRGVLNLGDKEKGKIIVDFTGTDETLLVKVTDNGMSRERSAELEKRKGLTIPEEDVLTRRIKLFNRQGAKKISVVLRNTADMNEASLEIPQPLFED